MAPLCLEVKNIPCHQFHWPNHKFCWLKTPMFAIENIKSRLWVGYLFFECSTHHFTNEPCLAPSQQPASGIVQGNYPQEPGRCQSRQTILGVPWLKRNSNISKLNWNQITCSYVSYIPEFSGNYHPPNQGRPSGYSHNVFLFRYGSQLRTLRWVGNRQSLAGPRGPKPDFDKEITW